MYQSAVLRHRSEKESVHESVCLCSDESEKADTDCSLDDDDDDDDQSWYLDVSDVVCS